MARRMTWLVTLPAAKTLVSGGRGRPWADALRDEPLLEDARRQVADALRTAAATYDAAAWAALVETEGAVAEEARRRAADLGAARTMPAHARYRGPVAQRLDGATLSGRQLRRVLFATAGAGVVRANDPVPDERLAISKALGDLGVLASFWRPYVDAWLDAHLSADGGVLWDLLGGEYARAVAVPSGRRRVVVHFTDGVRAAPSATAKQLRGLVARHLVTASTAPREPHRGLAGFAADVAGRRWAFAGMDGERPVVRTSA